MSKSRNDWEVLPGKEGMWTQGFAIWLGKWRWKMFQGEGSFKWRSQTLEISLASLWKRENDLILVQMLVWSINWRDTIRLIIRLLLKTGQKGLNWNLWAVGMHRRLWRWRSVPGSVLSTLHTLPHLTFNNFMSYSFFHSVIHQLPCATHRVPDTYPYLADEETEA